MARLIEERTRAQDELHAALLAARTASAVLRDTLPTPAEAAAAQAALIDCYDRRDAA